MVRCPNVIRWILLLFANVLLLGAFENEDDVFVQNNLGENYFPYSETSIWFDSIVSITIDMPSESFDTSIIVQKTMVDSIVDVELTTKIYCSRYILKSGTWQYFKRFWFEKSPTKLLRFEDNLIWFDLVFPIREGISWNYYGYNINSDTLLRNSIARCNYPGVVNGRMYDSLLEIYHQMDSTLIFKRTDASYYAANVGFLYRESVDIVSDDPSYDYTLPIEQRIKTATILRIKTYRNENPMYVNSITGVQSDPLFLQSNDSKRYVVSKY